MSKVKVKNKKSGTPLSSPIDNGYMYWPHQARHLEGRLLTFIESLGFSDARDKAVKDIMLGCLHDFYRNTIYIDPNEATKIAEEFYEKRYGSAGSASNN